MSAQRLPRVPEPPRKTAGLNYCTPCEMQFESYRALEVHEKSRVHTQKLLSLSKKPGNQYAYDARSAAAQAPRTQKRQAERTLDGEKMTKQQKMEYHKAKQESAARPKSKVGAMIPIGQLRASSEDSNPTSPEDIKPVGFRADTPDIKPSVEGDLPARPRSSGASSVGSNGSIGGSPAKFQSESESAEPKQQADANPDYVPYWSEGDFLRANLYDFRKPSRCDPATCPYCNPDIDNTN